MDYEAKARKADREFNGVEHARNGPPGPVLALLARSAKQFVSYCAEKGSITGVLSGAAMGRTRPEV